MVASDQIFVNNTPAEPIKESSDEGMSIQNMDPDQLIILKVRDIAFITKQSYNMIFILSSESTFNDFFTHVSRRLGISSELFDLVYQDPKGEIHEMSRFPGEEKFSCVNIYPTRVKEYSISLEKRKKYKSHTITLEKGSPCRKILNSRANPQPLIAEIQNENGTNNNSSTGTTSTTSIAHNDNYPKNCITLASKEFVGLKNRSMTCYLNSLLQSLWFTPEFRNSIYRFMNDESRQMPSIVKALQTVFLRLQFSERDSIGTEELTEAFGWHQSGDQIWQQQDIHELFQVLLDYLEDEFKGTVLNGLIRSLYGGLNNDYICCLNCRKVRCNIDYNMGLQLSVKNPFTSVIEKTLEDALRTYAIKEELKGSNQYNCSVCNTKTDAEKGLSFRKFPYILCISLKRFEFDSSMRTRRKITSKVEFPIYLDVNGMIDTENLEMPAEGSPNYIPPIDQKLTKSDRPLIERKEHSRPFVQISKDNKDNSEVLIEEIPAVIPNEKTSSASAETPVETKPKSFEDIQKLFQNGPYIYQLFSVLVHNGSLTGGHYFAFLYDFESSRWYRCDDTTVRRADEVELSNYFGNDDEDSRETSCAYMLMYRRIDSDLNTVPLIKDEFPSNLQMAYEELMKADRDDDIDFLEQDSMTVNILVRNPDDHSLTEKNIDFDRTDNLDTCVKKAYKTLYPNGEIEPNRIRFVRYNKEKDIIENSFVSLRLSMDQALGRSRPLTQNEGLLLEIRNPDEQFEMLTNKDLIFKTHRVVPNGENSSPVVQERYLRQFHMCDTDTVYELREKLSCCYKLPLKEILMIAHNNSDCPVYLENDNDLIGQFNFGRINQLYFQSIPLDSKEEIDSQVKKYVNIVTIKIMIDLTDQKEKLSISEKSDAIINGVECEITIDLCKKLKTIEFLSTLSFKKPALNGHLENDVEGKDLESSPSTSPLPSKTLPCDEITFEIQSEDISKDGKLKTLQCVVHRSTSMSCISSQLENCVGLSENNYKIFKVSNGEEAEIRCENNNVTINDLFPFDYLQIRLGQRLKGDERIVTIYLWDIVTPDKNFENPIRLSQFICPENKTINEVKESLKSEADYSKYFPENKFCQLRVKQGLQPGEILCGDQVLISLGSYAIDLYAQIFESTGSDELFSILIRFLNTEKMDLEQPKEIFLSKLLDRKAQEDEFANQIETLFGKKIEEIKLSIPIGKFPWSSNSDPMVNLTWFKWSERCNYLPENEELFLSKGCLLRNQFEDSTQEVPLDKPSPTICVTDKPISTLNCFPSKKEIGIRINYNKS